MRNTVMASRMKIGLFARVCVCVCVYLLVSKVYQINGSIVDRSKEDKNLSLLTYMGMCVCIRVMDRKYGSLLSLSPHVL